MATSRETGRARRVRVAAHLSGVRVPAIHAGRLPVRGCETDALAASAASAERHADDRTTREDAMILQALYVEALAADRCFTVVCERHGLGRWSGSRLHNKHTDIVAAYERMVAAGFAWSCAYKLACGTPL